MISILGRFFFVIAPILLISTLFSIVADAASCPNLTRNLSVGSRGQDVVELQNFLIAERDLAAGNNTGYYGNLTVAAVKTWQARNGVVSSGTAATNGYGAVGPKTRAAIVRICAAGKAMSTPTSSTPIPSNFQPQCPLVELPIGKPCNGTWKEVKDAKGCTASWQCQ